MQTVFLIVAVIFLSVAIILMALSLEVIKSNLRSIKENLDKIILNTDLDGIIESQTYHLIRLNNKLSSICHHYGIKEMDGEELRKIREDAESRQE